MKQKILLGLAALALSASAWGADYIWVNPSDTIVPSSANTNAPMIDAERFLNPVSLTFSIGNGYIGNFYGGSLYSFSDCFYITNKGHMFASPGFDFENITLDGKYRPAEWFVNLGSGYSGGDIDVSGGTVIFNTTFLPAYNGKILIRAKNIVNTGTITLGDASLLQLSGNYVDLTGGTLAMNNPGTYLDGYWGVGAQYLGGVPLQQYGTVVPSSSPMHHVTNRLYATSIQSLFMYGGVGYTNQFTNQIAINSNMLTQIVFLRNTKPGITNMVFFNPDSIQVQWNWINTNYPGTDLVTNWLALTDTFGERKEVAVDIHGTTFGGRPTYMPVNYTFSQNQLQGTPADAITNTSVILTNFGLPTARETNQYSAYQALFVPGVSLVSDVFGGDVTNIPGRVEVTANSLLNLSNAQITSYNYLSIKAPGHFAGNTGSQISAPNTDLELASTNGLLTVSGLIAPFTLYPSGEINLYSSRLTNDTFKIGQGTNAITVTNTIHVLFVDSEIDPLTTPTVETVKLTADNLVISDVLNVSRSLSLNTKSLTITTNPGNEFVPLGQVNLNSSGIFWPNAAQGMQYLTNWGQISSLNAIFFGGSHTQPAFDPRTIDIPYQTFINHGVVSDKGTYVWSKYFENSGIIDCGTGPFALEQGFSVRLLDSEITAYNGDIRLTASDLVLSNSYLYAGGSITLAVTNYLDDGSYLSNSVDWMNENMWFTADGLSLLVRPKYSSLLGTTVYADNYTRSQQNIVWASTNRGAVVDGFYNNAALGGLVLTGDNINSLFAFVPPPESPDTSNALYVEYLELDGTTGLTNANGKFQGITIDPHMKVYFGMLLVDGEDYSSFVNATNNPGLVWVPEILTNVPPVNPAPVYPPLVLVPNTPSNSNQGNQGNGGSTNPPTASTGPSKLDLPATARSGGAAGDFVAASYSGLFADTNGFAASSSGYFTVRTTARGQYTGKLTYCGQTYPFTGKLVGSNQVATASFTKGGLQVSFWLVSADATQLQGQVTGMNWTAELIAFRQASNKSVPAAATLQGAYTLIIPPAAGGPDGYGFGALKADASGHVRWAGTLGDGTKVTQGSFFSSGGVWGLYASLYAGRGSALGWLQLSSGSGTNLEGQCLWVKPAGAGPRYYPRGFTNDVQAIGSTYVKPHAGAVLPLNNGAGTLTFDGARLTSAVSKALSLDQRNRLSSSDNSTLSLKLNPSTGLFEGSLWLTPLGKVSFQGAVFQNGNFAAGSFLDVSESGSVLLSPAP